MDEVDKVLLDSAIATSKAIETIQQALIEMLDILRRLDK